jgi:hypothetical protein
MDTAVEDAEDDDAGRHAMKPEVLYTNSRRLLQSFRY